VAVYQGCPGKENIYVLHTGNTNSVSGYDSSMITRVRTDLGTDSTTSRLAQCWSIFVDQQFGTGPTVLVISIGSMFPLTLATVHAEFDQYLDALVLVPSATLLQDSITN